MNIKLPQDAVVILVGAMATGKSTLARKHFSPHHIVALDDIREQLTGDPTDVSMDRTAMDIMFNTIQLRMQEKLFTVVDAPVARGVVDTVSHLASTHKRDVVALQLPQLPEREVTKQRFGKRWFQRRSYYSQLKNMDNYKYPRNVEVHHVDDINTVKLFVQDSIKDNSLSDAYRYLIVPDLHGEVSVLNSLVDQYGDDPEMKFIFLGDIVDRGESSFETFRLVHRLIKSGKGHGVVSNHDNKAYRWFGKWLKDGDHKYKTETFDTYGMKVAYGLGKTLTEFHSLEPNHRKTYAEDFVEYYENLNPYLRLELPDAVHFFSHAGITRDVLKGMRVMRKDMAHLLYETLKEEHVYEDNHLNIDDNVVIHLGHDTYMEAPLIVFQDDTTKIWKHDFGLGKIDLHLPLPDHRFEIV